MTINNKGNMDDHIKKIKGTTETALQMIFTLAGNEEFHNIEMSTIFMEAARHMYNPNNNLWSRGMDHNKSRGECTTENT